MQTKKTFINSIRVYDELKGCIQLTSNEKLFIAYLLRWQGDGKVCIMSDQSLATMIGASVRAMRNMLRQLETHGFLRRQASGRFLTKHGHYDRTWITSIDQHALLLWLSTQPTMERNVSL